MFLLDGPAPTSSPGTLPAGTGAAAPVLVHTASDLVVAAECEHRLLVRVDELLGRAPRAPRTDDAMLARTAALGEAHERRVLAGLLDRYGPAAGDGTGSTGSTGGVVEVGPPDALTWEGLAAAHARTLGAVEAGADVVYQASFFDGSFHGRADFLLRDPLGDPDVGPGRPGAHAAPAAPRYAVVDTKLARRAKVPALLQAAAYADQLLAARVDPTDEVRLVLGTRRTTTHRLADLLPVLRVRRERLLGLVAAHRAQDGPAQWGAPGVRACGRCEACTAAVAARRDVLLVGGVYAGQRARLAAAGITTIDALAEAPEAPATMSAAAFGTLRLQAGLQLGTLPLDDPSRGEVTYPAGADAPAGAEPRRLRWALTDTAPVRRLPPPSPGDVFFDFEGDPLWSDPQGEPWGLDYLFGLVVRPQDPADAPPFLPFWAHDLAEERRALVAFVDWLTDRRRRWPDLHVYHYAAYEKTHLLSIAARHGVYEEEVDQLLRDGVLVDLYAVVRSALRISDRSRSIKKLEPLYMGADLRSGDVTDAAASVVAYADWTGLRDAGRTADADVLLQGIEDYNRYDCVSTLRLLDWLRWAADRAEAAVPAAGGAATFDPVAQALPGPADDVVAPGAGGPRLAAPAALAPPPTAHVPDLAAGPAGAAAPDGAASDDPADDGLTPRQRAVRATRARRTALEAAVRERVGEDRAARDDEAEALALLGATLGYWRREDKPFWHEHFSRLELPPDEWQGRRSTFHVEQGTVLRDWSVEPGQRRPSRELELVGRLAEGTELRDGVEPFLLYEQPAPEAASVPPGAARGFHRGGAIVAVARRTVDGRERDVLTVREHVGVGAPTHDALPSALTCPPGPPSEVLEQAAEEVLVAALARWDTDRTVPDGPATDLLRRRPPRLLSGGTLPPVTDGDTVAAVLAAVRDLDRSVVAVQGPPGTGKTHLGAHVVARLVADGWRVGVVAQSHAVVENLLRAAVVTGGVPVERVARKQPSDRAARAAGAPAPGDPVLRELTGDALPAFAAEGPCLVGGTAWDFAHTGRWPDESLDLLVVDEAGQLALATTVVVARSARRLLLLGDPQQLPQVSQGRHPEPVDRSALAWLGAGHDVLPDDLGYFLDRSWRMHPALCEAVSQLAYEGRLRSHPAAAARHLEGVAPGIHHVPVAHSGRTVTSPEEVEVVVSEVRKVVGAPWRAGEGVPERPLAPEDVLVVAAYNAQVWAVRAALDAAGLGGVAVGTVDRFQGREAPVAIVTLAASGGEDVPRGAGFLLSRRRVNVAVSRGQWCAVVVRSPQLTDRLPSTPRGLAELGGFLGLCDRDGEVVAR